MDAKARAAARIAFMRKAVFDRNGAGMQLHDARHDGQSQARTRHLGAQRAIEALKDALSFLGRNARAVVGDRDGRAVALGGDSDFNAPALGRIADGVVSQVGDEKRLPSPSRRRAALGPRG